MSKEIIRYTLYKEKSHLSTEQNRNINLLKGKNDNSIFSEKNKIKNEFKNMTYNNEYPEKKGKYKNNA